MGQLRMRVNPIIRKRTRAGPSSRSVKSRPHPITPVEKPIKDQGRQSARSTVSPSSPTSSLGHFIEHVLSFVGPPVTGKTSLGSLSVNRSLGPLVGRSNASPLVVCATRLRYGLLAQALHRAGRMDPALLLRASTPPSGVHRFDDST